MAEMTLLEAIQARHSVRKYKDEPIPEEVLAVLRNKVWEVNSEAGLHVQLVTGEPKAFSGLSCYGTFSGVMENPLETDPGIPLVIDPPLLFFSSDTQMQAVGIKNRSSLHSA